MIVATRPLVDCCPVVPAAMEGRQMVMWDKDSCADAGFLKIDLLGLGMLSAVERCVEQIARAARRADRPLADPLRRPGGLRRRSRRPRPRASSRSRAARRWPRCARTRPENLDDLTIQVAIVRPGPDPGRRGQPLHRAPPAAARGPLLRGPLRPPVAGAGAARHARDDHLPGPGHRGRDGLRRLLAGRGRGPAPRDEPQALGGGDRGLPPALRGRRAAPAGTTSTRRSPSASTR